MPFVDFAQLKSHVAIELVADMLALKLVPRGAQLRGPCPVCRAGGERSLVITPAKQAFYCFGSKSGGDLIALVAHIRSVNTKDAANLVAQHFGTGTSTGTSTIPQRGTGTNAPTRSSSLGEKGSDPGPLRPLDYLLAEHEAVQTLGISAETAQTFGAGYAPKGIMRGRFAIAIHDRGGKLLAYCGRAVSKDQQPTLIFPNGFRPESVIFNAERIEAGPLTLVRDPLDVLTAFDAGVENVIAFLSDITPQSLEMLAGLMDEKNCDTVELF